MFFTWGDLLKQLPKNKFFYENIINKSKVNVAYVNYCDLMLKYKCMNNSLKEILI